MKFIFGPKVTYTQLMLPLVIYKGILVPERGYEFSKVFDFDKLLVVFILTV